MNKILSISVNNYDAHRLMNGKYEELYNEKKSFTKPYNPRDDFGGDYDIDDLRQENLDILEKKIKQEIFRDIDVDPDDKTPWMSSHIDGMSARSHMIIMAVSTYADNNLFKMVRRHYAELQHYLFHTQRDKMCFSVMFEDVRFESTIIHSNYPYQRKLINAGEWFCRNFLIKRNIDE